MSEPLIDRLRHEAKLWEPSPTAVGKYLDREPSEAMLAAAGPWRAYAKEYWPLMWDAATTGWTNTNKPDPTYDAAPASSPVAETINVTQSKGGDANEPAASILSGHDSVTGSAPASDKREHASPGADGLMEEPHPWQAFLDVRWKAMQWMRADGKDDKWIAWHLSMNEDQVRAIFEAHPRRTPAPTRGEGR